MEYYIRRRNTLLGPFDLETLKEKQRINQLQNFDEIGESRKGPWKSVKELNLFVPTPLPNLPDNETIDSPPSSQTPADFASQSPISGTSPPTPEILYNRVPPGLSGSTAEWYYRAEEGEPGPPVSDKEIRSMIKRGDLDKEFYVWTDSMENWAPIISIFSVDFRIKQNRSIQKNTNNPLSQKNNSNTKVNNQPPSVNLLLNYDNHKKTPVVAYLLFIFLSNFGAHSFYLGRIAEGIGWIFMNVLFYCCCFSIGFFSGKEESRPLVYFLILLIFAYTIRYIIELITLNKKTIEFNEHLMRKLKG